MDWPPSGSFRALLMIDGQRYTAKLPTDADARPLEIETMTGATGACWRTVQEK